MADSGTITMTTCATADDARAIAEALIDKRVAACVQVLPIHSYYTWEGKTQSEDEQLLLIKAPAGRFADIAAVIKEVHKYDVPEIMEVPMTAVADSYLAWMREVTAAS